MKPKNTLILLIVALGLFAFISFYESKRPSTQQMEYARSHVAVFDSENINAITITNNEDKIELRRDGTAWEVVSPVKDRAEVPLVHQLLSEMEDLKAEDSFQVDIKNPENTLLKEYGLDTPSLRLKLSGPGAPPEILFGKDTPVEGKMYVRFEGANTICVASNKVKALLQKKADDFRDHKLMDLNAGQVNRLDVKSPAGEIEVLKEHAEWSVNKPLKARGDVQKISGIINESIETRIDSFLPENGANLASLGLAEPRGSVTLSTDGGGDVVLQIGQPLDNDRQKVYAKLSTRASILILPEKINDVLFIKPNDVRDKHLLKLNLDTVDRIHIQSASKPEITFVRKQEDWTIKTSGEIPANSMMVKNFAIYLEAQQITAFVSDVASDLAGYGLDKPQLKIIFSSYASENTAESKAGEVPILTLDFGKIDGNVIYARLENEPYVVSIPKNIFEVIPTDPLAWQDLAIYNHNPADFVSLEITRDGQTLALDRGENGAWVMKNAHGALNQTNVQSLLNTLSTLHTVRWTGSATTGLGFERPSLVISFVASGNKNGKLTIGGETSENMWNAEAEGRDGAFLIGKPDYDALHADMLEAAAPPSPAETPSAAPGGVK